MLASSAKKTTPTANYEQSRDNRGLNREGRHEPLKIFKIFFAQNPYQAVPSRTRPNEAG